MNVEKRAKIIIDWIDNYCKNMSFDPKSLVVGISGGIDSAFSLEPSELAQLVVETERANLALGSVAYGPTESEMFGRMYRRSLYVSEDIKEGEILSKSNVRSVRPGFGLHPKYLGMVLGRQAKCALLKGTPLSFDVI